MNLKACTFERLAFISLGFGRGAQVEKTALLEVKLISWRKRRRWAYSILSFGTLQVLGFRPNPRSLEEDAAFLFFFIMRSEDSETAHLLGSGPVLRHNNACVRDVLTAPSSVYLNLGLNTFHSYF